MTVLIMKLMHSTQVDGIIYFRGIQLYLPCLDNP